MVFALSLYTIDKAPGWVQLRFVVLCWNNREGTLDRITHLRGDETKFLCLFHSLHVNYCKIPQGHPLPRDRLSHFSGFLVRQPCCSLPCERKRDVANAPEAPDLPRRVTLSKGCFLSTRCNLPYELKNITIRSKYINLIVISRFWRSCERYISIFISIPSKCLNADRVL